MCFAVAVPGVPKRATCVPKRTTRRGLWVGLEAAEAGYGFVEDLVAFAEGESHEVAPGVGVVGEHLDRDGHHTDPFRQGAAALEAVVEAEPAHVGADEVGPLRAVH